MVIALKKIGLVLFLSILLICSSRYILAKEYSLSIGVGSQISIEVKKALNVEFEGKTVNRGDKISVKVTSVEGNTVGSDVYKEAYGDIYINNEKVAENVILMYPYRIFFIYPDIDWIKNILEPEIEQLEGKIKYSEDGSYVSISWQLESGITIYEYEYIWKDGIISYFYQRTVAAGDVISEIELGKKEINWSLILPPIILIVVIVAAILIKRKLS